MDRFLLFPLLAPAVLLAAGNDAFGFDPPGYLDSFVYVGYFWHYPEHLWVFDDNSNYKISRLPWILPGYVLHALAGPIVASYVLAYVTLALGAVALFLLVKECLDDRGSAAIVSVAWACCTWAHGNGGWNYQVLIASGYYLMTCWLVVRAARGRSRVAQPCWQVRSSPPRFTPICSSWSLRRSWRCSTSGRCRQRKGERSRAASGRRDWWSLAALH